MVSKLRAFRWDDSVQRIVEGIAKDKGVSKNRAVIWAVRIAHQQIEREKADAILVKGRAIQTIKGPDGSSVLDKVVFHE